MLEVFGNFAEVILGIVKIVKRVSSLALIVFIIKSNKYFANGLEGSVLDTTPFPQHPLCIVVWLDVLFISFRRLKLSKTNEKKLNELFSSRCYVDTLPKKEEKSLCSLLDSLSCTPVPSASTTTTTSPSLAKPGFIYTNQVNCSFNYQENLRKFNLKIV